MQKSQLFGLALVCALAGLLGLTEPAAAGRPISADTGIAPSAITLCHLGSACSGVVLNSNRFQQRMEKNDYQSLFVPAGPPFPEPAARMFIYAEGVVSFGEALPTMASLAGGIASLGSGNWFAPSFGEGATHLFVKLYVDNANSSSVSYGTYRLDWDILAATKSTAFEIYLRRDSDLQAANLFFNGDPVGGGKVAYNYRPFVDPLFPIASQDHNEPSIGGFTLAGAGRFGIPAPRPGVPEPGAWALLLMGFGVIGSALRARRRAIARMC